MGRVGCTALHVRAQRLFLLGPAPPKALSHLLRSRPSRIRPRSPPRPSGPAPAALPLTARPRVEAPPLPHPLLTAPPRLLQPRLPRPSPSQLPGPLSRRRGCGAPRLLCRDWTAARALPSAAAGEGRTRAYPLSRRRDSPSVSAVRLRASSRLSVSGPGGRRPEPRAGARALRTAGPGGARPLPSLTLSPAQRAHAGPGTRPPRWQGPGPSCQEPRPQPFRAASGPDARPEKMSLRCSPQPSETRSRRARGRLPR